MRDARHDQPGRGRRHRGGILAGMAVGVAAIFAPGLLRAVSPQALVTPRLVYNASDSVPAGFYAVLAQPLRVRDLSVGDLIVTRLPAAAARLAAERRYLPAGVPLIKPIAAAYGDHVCVQGGVVRINGRIVARTLAADHLGRPLAAWPGCRLLGADEWFLLATNRVASFDSRYFGPVPCTAAYGRAVPLWIWRTP